MPLQTATTFSLSLRQGETLEQHRFRFFLTGGVTPWSPYGATIVATMRRAHATTTAVATAAQWTSANGKVAVDTAACTATIVATAADTAALTPGSYELSIGVVGYTGATHVVGLGTVTLIAAGAEFDSTTAPTVDPQSNIDLIVTIPALPVLDDPDNADVGFELNSLVFGDMNSQFWYADALIGATSPAREYTTVDTAMTAPTGVKAGYSYLLNNGRTASTSRVGRRFKTPLGCDSVTFEFHARRHPSDDGPETIVLAIYEDDGTTLVDSQVVTLGARVAACSLTADVSGDTEYMACVWFNNAALGTVGDGGTSARGYFSRCRVVPSGDAMTGVFARDFWGVERVPWEYVAAYAASPPAPRGWGTDPVPTLTYPSEATLGEALNFAPMVLRCSGTDAAAEYYWAGSGVPVWGSPLVRTSAVGAPNGDDASAPTGLQITNEGRMTAAITMSGAGPRLLQLAAPQTSRITRAYVGAYDGTQVEPVPAFGRVLFVMGDSISVGYQIDSTLGAYELLRDSFPGLLIKYGAGGTSLASLGYVGSGGVLDPAQAATRTTTNSKFTGTDPAPTEFLLELATNDWGAGAISKANYKIGVEGIVDWFHGQFPAAHVYLQHPINRDGENTPNAGGAILDDFRDAMDEVAAARSAWCSVITMPAIELADGVHPTQAGYATMATTLIAALVP